MAHPQPATDTLEPLLGALTGLREEARIADPENWWLQASELVTLGYAHLAIDISQALARAGFGAGSTILDWGAGPGYLTYLLEQLGHEVTYYDFDYGYESYDFVLRRLHGNRLFIGEEQVRLPFADDSLDGVVSFGVLEHVPDMEGSLAEVMRVLKPGGLLLVYHFPNRFSWTEAMARLLGRPHHDVRLTRRELRELVTAPGFQVVSSAYRYLMPRNLTTMPRLRGWMSRHARGVYAFDAGLVRIPLLRLFSTTHSLVLRKPVR